MMRHSFIHLSHVIHSPEKQHNGMKTDVLAGPCKRGEPLMGSTTTKVK
jgi:hypothetical protein